MLSDVACAVMQGIITEDVTMPHWMSTDAVGSSDSWHNGLIMVLPVVV